MVCAHLFQVGIGSWARGATCFASMGVGILHQMETVEGMGLLRSIDSTEMEAYAYSDRRYFLAGHANRWY